MAKLSRAYLNSIRRFATDEETGEEYEVEMTPDEKEDWLLNGDKDSIVSEMRVYQMDPETNRPEDMELSEVEREDFLSSTRSKINLRANLDEKGNRKQGSFDKFVDNYFKPSSDEPLLIGAVKLAFYLELKILSSIWEGIQMARTSSESKEMKAEKEQELKERAKEKKRKAEEERSKVEDKYEKRIKELEEKLAAKDKTEPERQAEGPQNQGPQAKQPQQEQNGPQANTNPQQPQQQNGPQANTNPQQPQQQQNGPQANTNPQQPQQQQNGPQVNVNPQQPQGPQPRQPQTNQNINQNTNQNVNQNVDQNANLQNMMTQLMQMMVQYMAGQQTQNNPQAQSNLEANQQMLNQMQDMLNIMQNRQPQGPQNRQPEDPQNPQNQQPEGPQNQQPQQPGRNLEIQSGSQINIQDGNEIQQNPGNGRNLEIQSGSQINIDNDQPVNRNDVPQPQPQQENAPKRYIPPRRTEADDRRVAEVNTAMASREGIENFIRNRLSEAPGGEEQTDELEGIRSTLQSLAEEIENNPEASHLEQLEGLRQQTEAYLAEHNPVDAKDRKELSDILSVRALYNAMTDAKVTERLQEERENIIDNASRENLVNDDSLVEFNDMLKTMPQSFNRDFLIESIGELREEMVNNPDADHLKQLQTVAMAASHYLDGVMDEKPDFTNKQELKEVLESVKRVRQKDKLDERLDYKNYLTPEGVKNTLRDFPAGAKDSPEFSRLRESLTALDAAYSEEEGPNKEMHIANARRKAAMAAEIYANNPENAPTVDERGWQLSGKAAAEAQKMTQNRLALAVGLAEAYNTLQKDTDQNTIETRQEALKQEREARQRQLEEKERIRREKEAELKSIGEQRTAELKTAVNLEREESSLQEEIDSRGNRLSELERENVRLTAEFEAANREYEAARNDFTRVVNEMNQLGKDDAALKADRAKLDADRKALEQEVMQNSLQNTDVASRKGLREDMKANTGNEQLFDTFITGIEAVNLATSLEKLEEAAALRVDFAQEINGEDVAAKVGVLKDNERIKAHANFQNIRTSADDFAAKLGNYKTAMTEHPGELNAAANVDLYDAASRFLQETDGVVAGRQGIKNNRQLNSLRRNAKAIVDGMADHIEAFREAKEHPDRQPMGVGRIEDADVLTTAAKDLREKLTEYQLAKGIGHENDLAAKQTIELYDAAKTYLRITEPAEGAAVPEAVAQQRQKAQEFVNKLDENGKIGKFREAARPGGVDRNRNSKWLGNDDLNNLSEKLSAVPGVGYDLRQAYRELKEAREGEAANLPAREYVKIYEEARKFIATENLTPEMRTAGITIEQLSEAKAAAKVIVDRLDVNNRYKKFKAVADFQQKMIDFTERAKQIEDRERALRERELKQNERGEKLVQAQAEAERFEKAKNKQLQTGKNLNENRTQQENIRSGKSDLESRRDELTFQRKQSMERAKQLRNEARRKEAELNGNRNNRNENVM